MGLPQIVSKVIEQHQIPAAVVLASGRGFVGDAIAQNFEHVEDGSGLDFDWPRSRTYMLWTIVVTFTIDVMFYTHLFPRWFPSQVDGVLHKWNVVKAVMCDNFLLTPIFFFPLFYCFKESFMGGASVQQALGLYVKESPTQLPAVWAYWVPCHGIMFSAVPVHLRVAWCCATATGYVTILSLITQKLTNARAATAPGKEAPR